MNNYDFSTLNYADFEKLVCDLLNCRFSDQNNTAFFRSFKEGKDQGIDLLHSTTKYDHDIVVQVKHYKKSPKSNLFNDLKTKEKPKVDELKPNTYVFVTSLPLNANDKKKIKNIFNPHLKNLADIYGQDDLNDILRLNQHIEENHYKLWFSSTQVLNKILTYKYEGRRNEFTEEILKKKFRLFVVTSDYFKAKASLKTNKFIIISGNPGVGKTTLSDMLIYDFIKDDYQLNIIYENIKEIENTLKLDESKQVFYFDDFLGHTAAEISKLKSTDSVLIRLLSRIEKQKNKYVILNTRKFILSPFLDESEKLRNFNLLKAETQIELVYYTYGIKRKILDNHILESDLNNDLKIILYKLAKTICLHSSFTPRIIEFFTGSKVSNFNAVEFESFVTSNLENPKEIWSHAYRKQITDYDRFVLNTLYSLNGSSTKNDLEKAFNSRLDYEVNNNNFLKPLDSFNSSLRNLNEGFLNIDNNENISLINPSLIDYLDNFFAKNQQEKERVFISSIFIEQWYFFYQPFHSKKGVLPSKLLDHITSMIQENTHKLEILSINNDDNERIFNLLLFYYFFSSNRDKNILIGFLNEINDWSFIDQNHLSLFLLPRFMSETTNIFEVNDIIGNYDWQFYMLLLQNQNSLDELIDNFNLMSNHYGFSFWKILNDIDSNPKRNSEVYNFIDKVKTMFDLESKNTYKYLKDRNTERDYHLMQIERMQSYKAFINNNIALNIELNLNSLINIDWNYYADLNITDFKTDDSEIDYDERLEEEYQNFYDDPYFEDYRFELLNEPKKVGLLNFEEFLYGNSLEEDDLPF